MPSSCALSNGFEIGARVCYDNIRVCKLIVSYIANANSAEREMSASACTRSVAGLYFVITINAIQTFVISYEWLNWLNYSKRVRWLTR